MDQALSPQEEFAAAFEEIASGTSEQVEPQARPAKEELTAAPAPAKQADEKPKSEAEPVDPDKVLIDLRRQLSEANHRERSSAQRVSAFQRKFNEAEIEIASLRKRAEAAAPAAAPELQDDDDASALLKEMPDLSRALDRAVAKRVKESVDVVQQQVQQVEQGMQPLRQRAEQDAVRAEIAVVEKEFPGWRDTVFSPDFEQWIGAKPSVIRQAYDQASSAADALEFLRMFDRERAKPATPAQDNAQAGSKQARLERAVGPQSKAVARPVGGLPAPDDFDGAFAYFAARSA